MLKQVIALLGCWISLTAAAASPYTGEEGHDIKSLSAAEVSDYLSGEGMGYARAAELNHYPGPRHVLDLSQEIGLTRVQRGQSQQLFQRMQRAAAEAGARLVTAERELDRRFASGRIDAATLERSVRGIAVIEAEIRFIHLQAHLEQKALLNPEQVSRYDRLRGYAAPHGHHHHPR